MGARSSGSGWTTGVYPRLLGAIAALGLAAGAVLVVAFLVRGLPAVASGQTSSPVGGGSTPAPAAAPSPRRSSTGFPTPPPGSVVLAKQFGGDALGLAVRPAGSGIGLQASLVKLTTSAGKPVPTRFVVRAADGRTVVAAATPCGNGCYRATAPVAKPRTVTVVMTGHKPSRASFVLPKAWPLRSGAAIVAQARRSWLELHTMVIRDRLGDGSVTLQTIWTIVAPDRLELAVNDGERSIVIGDKRWTKPAGSSKWITSPQTPVQQPQPFWVKAVDAHVLGTVIVKDRPAWKVSFFDPATPGWYTILVDKATKRTLEMWMTAQAHFMHDQYGSFDAPVKVVPPSGQ
jgi:hypothetical protein